MRPKKPTPAWPSTEAAKIYANLRDHQCVRHLLMTLRDEFESIQSSLLHRNPLPTLDTMIKDLISEEARLDTLRAKHTPPSTNVVLATQVSPKFIPSAQTSSSSTTQNSFRSSCKNFYNYCKKYGHIISECRRLQSKQSSSQNTAFYPVHTFVAATIEESFESTSPKFSTKDIQVLLQ